MAFYRTLFVLGLLLCLSMAETEHHDDDEHHDDGHQDKDHHDDAPHMGKGEHSGEHPPSGKGHKKRPEDPDISSSHQHYDDEGHHDDEYDHEAVAGSHKAAEEFKELSPEESKRRLSILLDRLDTNKDSKISQEELKNWIIESFKNLDIENSQHKLAEHDENNDHKVTWFEQVSKSYGYTEKELKELEKEKNEDMKGFMETLALEKMKFEAADLDKDGSLDLKEYTAFAHPQNYLHMAPFEIKKTLQDFDKNKDGLIDEKEFIGDDKLDKSTLDLEQQSFKSFDKNNDGHLDHDEMIPWIMPGFNKTATDEASHLFQETDANKDGHLTKEEVLSQHELWVGSHATDYGKHLDDMKKEEL